MERISYGKLPVGIVFEFCWVAIGSGLYVKNRDQSFSEVLDDDGNGVAVLSEKRRFITDKGNVMVKVPSAY